MNAKSFFFSLQFFFSFLLVVFLNLRKKNSYAIILNGQDQRQGQVTSLGKYFYGRRERMTRQ